MSEFETRTDYGDRCEHRCNTETADLNVYGSVPIQRGCTSELEAIRRRIAFLEEHLENQRAATLGTVDNPYTITPHNADEILSKMATFIQEQADYRQRHADDLHDAYQYVITQGNNANIQDQSMAIARRNASSEEDI